MHGIFARPSSQPLRSTFRAVRPLLFVGHASKSQGPGPGGKDFCQTTRVGTARLPYTLLHALMLPLEPHVWFTAVCKLRASKTGVERSSLSHFPPGHPSRKTSVHSLSTLRIPKAREVLTPPFQLQGAHQKTQTPCCPLKKVKTLKVRGRGVRLRRKRLCRSKGVKERRRRGRKKGMREWDVHSK